MKLELKHLAPYLNYGLKMIRKIDFHSEDWNNFQIGTLDQLRKNLTTEDWFTIGLDINLKSYQITDSLNCKPILRPLSDLNKPINHDNITFIPIETYVGIGDLKTISKTQVVSRLHSYAAHDFLFAHHFDVFGLIDKGLALDTNTPN